MALTGAQGVKMLHVHACICPSRIVFKRTLKTSSSSILKSPREFYGKQADKKTGRQAGKQASRHRQAGIQSEPCPVGACWPLNSIRFWESLFRGYNLLWHTSSNQNYWWRWHFYQNLKKCQNGPQIPNSNPSGPNFTSSPFLIILPKLKGLCPLCPQSFRSRASRRESPRRCLTTSCSSSILEIYLKFL